MQNKKVSDEVIEKLCIKLCLPFLRIATMLYHQLYERAALPGTSSTSGGGNASNEQPAEIFKSELEEWCTLSRYIGLGQMSSERPLSFIDSIHWACAEPTVLIGNWLAEFDQFFLANSLTAQVRGKFVAVDCCCLIVCPNSFRFRVCSSKTF